MVGREVGEDRGSELAGVQPMQFEADRGRLDDRMRAAGVDHLREQPLDERCLLRGEARRVRDRRTGDPALDGGEQTCLEPRAFEGC